MKVLFLVDDGKNIRVVQQPNLPGLEGSSSPKGGAMGEDKQLERGGAYAIFICSLPALDMVWGSNIFIGNHVMLHPVFGVN